MLLGTLGASLIENLLSGKELQELAIVISQKTKKEL